MEGKTAQEKVGLPSERERERERGRVCCVQMMTPMIERKKVRVCVVACIRERERERDDHL